MIVGRHHDVSVCDQHGFSADDGADGDSLGQLDLVEARDLLKQHLLRCGITEPDEETPVGKQLPEQDTDAEQIGSGVRQGAGGYSSDARGRKRRAYREDQGWRHDPA